jgi:hypothetical protein
LFLHLLEIILLMMLLQGRAAFCYIQAYWWNIRNLPDTLSIRKKIQSKRTVDDLKIITQRYFVYSKINSLIKVGIPRFQ